MRIEEIVKELQAIAADPAGQLTKYKAEGKKAIGVLPYYAPEELVYASGMVPFGIWGSNTKTISRAKEYCATFYCTIAQLALEMLLDGTMDELDGIITPTICDTLRPMSQNFRVAMSDKMRVIFLAHPQNRWEEFGLEFTMDQYNNIKKELEEVSGKEITDEQISEAIKVYNASRKARREFIELAGLHPETISAVQRSAVLKSAFFMLKPEHTALIEELNAELKKLPVVPWEGAKVVTSGIICDNPKLLSILDEYKVAIVADDVAHESRPLRVDADETGDPMRALAKQFADQDYEVLLYDKFSSENRRGEYVANLCKEKNAGLILFMQQFCDPEEMEYPYLKKALEEAGVAHIKLGIDQQMRDFEQARTAIQSLAEVIA